MYDITPVPKPRMTRQDKFKNPARPPVARYWAFKKECQLKMKGEELDGQGVVFYLPMPKSWSEKKKAEMDQMPHRGKPDLDNLFKGLGDALYGDDSHIAEIHCWKVWARTGGIKIL